MPLIWIDFLVIAWFFCVREWVRELLLFSVLRQAVFLETGVAEAHIIKKEFSALMPDELRQFSAFINKAIL